MSKAAILEILPSLRSDERREILDRICDLEEAGFSSAHQQLVDEALRSGPARPATAEDWNLVLQRGLERSRAKA